LIGECISRPALTSVERLLRFIGAAARLKAHIVEDEEARLDRGPVGHEPTARPFIG
jgi:hypothetical protein